MKKLASATLVLTIACAGTARSGETQVYGKLGVNVNGDYSGFSGPDRLLYHAGVDFRLTDLVSLGPELKYQHRKWHEEYFWHGAKNIRETISNNYQLFANVTYTPRPKSQAVAAHIGAGIGVDHVNVSNTYQLEGAPYGYDSFQVSSTKVAWHAFGGVRLWKHLVAECEVSRMSRPIVHTLTDVSFDGSLAVQMTIGLRL
ncbi:MAG: outer membrane beta-barrel protein [Acidobacteria bacterium]|nr:outer membrane beta-barrel protein [Acidobacteriota bacterium]